MATHTLKVRTDRRTQLLEVTDQVQEALSKSKVSSGVCYVFVPHTTAGVMINEHADPDVASDLEGIFDRMVPHRGPYRHAEGNTDSHMKTVMTGTSQVIFVEGGGCGWGGGRECFCASLMGRGRGSLGEGCGRVVSWRAYRAVVIQLTHD